MAHAKFHRALDEVDRKDIVERFLEVNNARLALARQVLSPRQQIFLDLLTFLFHTNHPMMPGFVSHETAAGLSGYVPDKETLEAARRIARSFEYKKILRRKCDIESIFLMGSVGSIAYSSKSDLDIWLCHSSGLGKELRKNLQLKSQKISEWAATLGLEVHFFVMTAEDLREGRRHSLSGESSGSAQRHLLLDEFYRTALLVGGRYPYWWLIPPGKEGEYTEYVKELQAKRFIRPAQFIDLGQISHIPANEFFGASLWQLFKAIDSPYKSVLKILLLEAYASEYPKMELLSHDYKRLIFSGKYQLEELDPYLLMVKKVEGYLKQHRDNERLQVAQQSFYFKVGQKLGSSGAGKNHFPATRLLSQTVKEWGWNRARLITLDAHEQWNVEQVVEERHLLFTTLMRSYKFLSNFARERHELAAISQSDMNMLGRRLFAAFERKAGKVELINPGISSDLSESQLQIKQIQKGEQSGWSLYRGAASTSQQSGKGTTALKVTHTLLELMAWCHFNGLTTGRTKFTVTSGEKRRTEQEISSILRSLRKEFPHKLISEPLMDELSRPSHPIAVSLFINIAADPLAQYHRHGRHLTSDRMDPLNYGSGQENTALTFDYMYLTNWGEIFVHRHSGMDGLMACLREHLRTLLKRPEIPLSSHCYSPNQGRSIARRIQHLFNDTTGCFRTASDREGSRYLLKGGGAYYTIRYNNGDPEHHQATSEKELLEHLGRPNDSFSPIIPDRRTALPPLLRLLCENNRAERIQIFIQVVEKSAEVYILDEHGSLFHDTLTFHRMETTYSHLIRFLDKVNYRETAAAVEHEQTIKHHLIEFNQLQKSSNGGLTARLVTMPTSDTQSYLELQVITKRLGEKAALSIYYDDVEFSTLEHGEALFREVARHIVQKRKDHEVYPIYITDLDLSGILDRPDGTGSLQTIHYLHYKKQIEKQLNEALSRA